MDVGTHANGAVGADADEAIARVIEAFDGIVQPDGGRVSFVAIEGARLRVAYAPGVNADCPTCVMEPDALVTYDRPTRLDADDLPYFLHRWSEAGTAAGLAHFQRRFGLDDDDPYLVQQRRFLAWHRQVALHPLDRWLRPLGRKRARDLAARLVARKAARLEARRLARP